MLNLLAGHDPKDMTSAKRQAINYVDKLHNKQSYVLTVIDEIVETISDHYIKIHSLITCTY